MERADLKILALVEATTVNAVARNVIDFQKNAREVRKNDPSFPNVEVAIVTFVRNGTTENDFIAAARDAGILVHLINERGRFDRRITHMLREICNDVQPDVVVTHSVKSHFVMFRSKVWAYVPWIAYHHGYTATDLKMRFYNLFDRRSLPKAERVVTVCKAFADDLAKSKRVPRERISVLHNSIRPQPRPSADQEQSLRDHLGIGSNQKIILSVGRLSTEKAQADLISAFALLLQKHPQLNAQLVIVGDGPELGNLQDQAASTAVSSRIVFAGQVKDVQPYYAIADALANSSHSEGSPYVLLEAMAARVPIVATAVGGVSEMLHNDDSALLVPSREPKAVADAIARVLGDNELARRLKARAAELAKTQFAPETYVRALVRIYREVIAQRALETS